MNKAEKKCRDMADVCELAHRRTVRECNKRSIKVDCTSLAECGDEGQAHEGDEEFEEVGDHYTAKAQEIFDKHYDYICEVTGL